MRRRLRFLRGASGPEPAAALIVTVQDQAGNVATSVRQLCGICGTAGGPGGTPGNNLPTDALSGNHGTGGGAGSPAAP